LESEHGLSKLLSITHAEVARQSALSAKMFHRIAKFVSLIVSNCKEQSYLTLVLRSSIVRVPFELQDLASGPLLPVQNISQSCLRVHPRAGFVLHKFFRFSLSFATSRV
jgi:hypothetical protein